MLKVMRPLLEHKLFILIPLGYTLLLTIGSLIKPVEIDDVPDHFDKLVHAGSYFVLATLWFVWKYFRTTKTHSFFYICLALIAYGIFIEYLQGTWTTYRSSDIYDGLANGIGVILAWIILYVIFNKTQMLKSKN